MTTLPGRAYPVIISMGTGSGQRGLGQGVLGDHTQLRGQGPCFLPLERGPAARAMLPRLSPAGLCILCASSLSQTTVLQDTDTPGLHHPFLNWGTPRRAPALVTPCVERPGLISHQLRSGDQEPRSFTSIPSSGWQEGQPATGRTGVRGRQSPGSQDWTCSGKGPMIMSKMEICVRHPQAPAED